MAGGLSSTGANRALDHMLGTATYTPGACKLRLTTTAPTFTTLGTEVTGGSYTAGGKAITFQAATNSQANNNVVTWTGMPACTVVGWEIIDSTGQRNFWGTFTTARQLAAGDTFTVAANALDISAS